MNRLFMSLILSGILLFSTFGTASCKALPLPEDYPPILSKTALVMLDEHAIQQASQEKSKIKLRPEWLRMIGYDLGFRSYGLQLGMSKWNRKTDIQFGLITPFSAAKYLHYYAGTQFERVPEQALRELEHYNHLAFIIVYPEETDKLAISTTLRDVILQKDGVTYPYLPKETYIPEVLLNMHPQLKRERIWPFPIDLFSKNATIEIVTTDKDGIQKRNMITSENIAKLF